MIDRAMESRTAKPVGSETPMAVPPRTTLVVSGLLDADTKRKLLRWGLMLSPLAFALISSSVYAVLYRCALDSGLSFAVGSPLSVTAAFLANLASLLAMAGPASWALLLPMRLPIRLPYRVALGVALALVGGYVYLVTVMAVCVLIGLPYHRVLVGLPHQGFL